MTDTRDAVIHAMNGDAKEFKDAINDIMTSKVQSALELKKLEVSSQFMSTETEVEEEELDVDQEI